MADYGIGGREFVVKKDKRDVVLGRGLWNDIRTELPATKITDIDSPI